MNQANGLTVRGRLREVEREVFARRPEHDIEPSLERIAALATLLGDPHRAYPVIHVTGTNGKTSIARMTEALLRARGLRTGLFTSPHLSSVRERICVDGEPVSVDTFVALYDEVSPYVALVDGRQRHRLSFFEVLTGMAFAAFADAPVDVAVIEVGLGGTWDATNIADGAVAVVGPVAIDHTRYLGETVPQIAAEKAGIIKPGATAVLASQRPEAAAVLLRRASEVGAEAVRQGIEFGVLNRELAVGGQQVSLVGLGGEYPGLFLPLFGEHQASNASCALAAVEAFGGVGRAGRGTAPAGWQALPEASDVWPAPGWDDGPAGDATPAARRTPPDTGLLPSPQAGDNSKIDGESGVGQLDVGVVREGFSSVRVPGRLEVVRGSPVVIVDCAHNPAGMAVSLGALTEAFSFEHLVAVLAVAADKDVAGILGEMEPVVSELIVTRNSSERSMDVTELAGLAESVFGEGRVRAVERLGDAIETVVGLADEAAAGGLPGSAGVLVTGSVVTAGDARLLLRAAAVVDDGP